MNHWSNLPEEMIDAKIALAAAKIDKGIKFHPDSDHVEVGIDTQCSRSICNNKDMIRNETVCNVRIRGIGGIIVKATVQGDWILPITSDDGRTTIQIIPNTVLCEQAGKSLLSPQHFFQKYLPGSLGRQRGKEITTAESTVFIYGNKGEYKCTIPITKENANVPVLKTKPSLQSLHSYMADNQNLVEDIFCHECTTYATQQDLPIVSDDEESISEAPDAEINNTTSPSPTVLDPDVNPQDENINDIAIDMPPSDMIVEPDDHQPTTPTAELLQYHYRLNHCSFKKLHLMAKLRPIPHRLAEVKEPVCPACKFGRHTRKAWRTKAKPRPIRKATAPGQVVSVDMMESRLPGFIAQLKGKLTKSTYKGAVVFVDHFSKYVHVELIRDFTSKSTVEACEAFEAKAADMGVNIKHYHCDNGRFVDHGFRNHCQNRINIDYCGVDAHHQNGLVERYIRILSEGARTSLWHALLRWPKVIILQLWPYALRQEALLRNSVPGEGGKGASPLELFSRSTSSPNLKNFKTIFCPVYKHQSALASGKSLPRWNTRCKLGINLGNSPRHAGNVYLVLDPVTGLTSPQFHCSFDNFFESVSDANANFINIDEWQYKAGFKKGGRRSRFVQRNTATEEELNETDDRTAATSYAEATRPTPTPVEFEHSHEMQDDDNGETDSDDGFIPVQSSRPRRANAGQGVNRLNIGSFKGKLYQLEALEADFIDKTRSNESVEHYYEALHSDDYKEQEEMRDPIAFAAKLGDDDFHYHKAMKQDDKREFQAAMQKEFQSHITKKNFKLMPLSRVPMGTKILDAVWAMKRKRDILTNAIIKWKARLNVHGGQQEKGVNYEETYSPVAMWTSIRTLLVLSILNKWHTRQVDFVLAFPQAPIEYELFMKLPAGIKIDGVTNRTHCLQLLRNLYGQKQAGRVWNRFLVEGLLNIGFKQSTIDECVFYKGNVIFFVYVDDGCFVGPNKDEIDQAIADLKNPDIAKNEYDIEDRGDLADYLGINFTKLEGNKLKMTQPQLIDQVIEQVQGESIGKFSPKSTPAVSSRLLHRDINAPVCKGSFHYRSVIGKLNYLEKGTRPDITYATHAAARFCSDPRITHEMAVSHITRYLQDTKDEGIIIDPDAERTLEVYADADFVGNYNKSTAKFDPSTAKSSEYYALSQALREAIPIMDLLEEIRSHGLAKEYIPAKVYCKAFEDNSGALEMATVHKIRPRTKHINNVYHHFREHVRSGRITVHAISTKEQFADMFTKPLDASTFLYLRKKYLKW
ncbi:hypothetical protein CTEN210_01012 [Chaetoceros tenuissimus]|uniref:Integrase catalytic domain-containing protein n=1 Tax=Chaetoceros tenuissimus TaxID=426638 RepID=A0AAD3GZH1_9STRA|nr:hypothetical protein CTEN210_01012 [Chaetoceros tenuissimus]